MLRSSANKEHVTRPASVTFALAALSLTSAAAFSPENQVLSPDLPSRCLPPSAGAQPLADLVTESQGSGCDQLGSECDNTNYRTSPVLSYSLVLVPTCLFDYLLLED